MTDKKEELLASGDVAKMLNVSTSTVRRLVDSGHLRTEVAGGRHVFKRDVVEAYAAKTLKRTVGYSPKAKESALRALRNTVLALREENERLRAEVADERAESERLCSALEEVMGACGPACCADCDAYYVAKKALDDTKEKP